MSLVCTVFEQAALSRREQLWDQCSAHVHRPLRLSLDYNLKAQILPSLQLQGGVMGKEFIATKSSQASYFFLGQCCFYSDSLMNQPIKQAHAVKKSLAYDTGLNSAAGPVLSDARVSEHFCYHTLAKRSLWAANVIYPSPLRRKWGMWTWHVCVHCTFGLSAFLPAGPWLRSTRRQMKECQCSFTCCCSALLTCCSFVLIRCCL